MEPQEGMAEYEVKVTHGSDNVQGKTTSPEII